MRNLITYEEISQLARPCTTDEDMAKAMIAEAQRVEIKPRLGDALYLRLLNPDEEIILDGGDAQGAVGRLTIDTDETAKSTASDIDPYQLLLEGGRWVDSCGNPRLLSGIKTALAYYALARITRDGNIQETRYGSAVKDDQYSMEPEKTERQRQYRELFGQADSYMAEVLAFLKDNHEDFPEYNACAKMRSNRMTIRTIGK
jgi:hypothetical protein